MNGSPESQFGKPESLDLSPAELAESLEALRDSKLGDLPHIMEMGINVAVAPDVVDELLAA